MSTACPGRDTRSRSAYNDVRRCMGALCPVRGVKLLKLCLWFFVRSRACLYDIAPL